ncbi:MAG: cytochrome c oxidase assembly protein [Actinomycetota bacterium]
MTGALMALGAVLYGLGIRGYDGAHPDRPFPRRAVAAFAAGLLALAAVLVGPVDRLAGERFAWHMAQHLVVTMVAAPLLLLGRPVGLARRAAPAPVRRALLVVLRTRGAGWLTHPVVTWSGFAVTLWASHFTSLYQRSIESASLHAVEHALYLAASLLFWLPVIGAEPSRHRLGPAARLLYVFLAAAVSSLLASTLVQSGRVLYPAYAGPGALADQRTAGALMWIVGGLLFLGAALLVAGAWARSERSRVGGQQPEGATPERA